ncbi:hypothetical protein BGW80DRAFT_1283797 [Lactifluus volemus]|nr:hypothetical protein BGW80DRAFT_1283797 [Lactifluus volemus]
MPFPSLALLALPLLACTGFALPHSHPFRSSPPRTWFHPPGHRVHALFRRQNGTGLSTGTNYPTFGSPTWAAAYPAGTPDAGTMPQAWKDALNSAVQAGKIPSVPISSAPNNGTPAYPPGFDPTSDQVCSATYKCKIEGDIWDAPDGVIGVSFDDGPLPVSVNRLYDFCRTNNQKVTHFVIGLNIIRYSKQFLTAFNVNQDDIAVHTWTHPHMTTLSNDDVVAQLAWTMELIHNSTGGRVPRFWRPPYGDTDARVSAIAKEVLGLTTIIWNHDTEDWTLSANGTTPVKFTTICKHGLPVVTFIISCGWFSFSAVRPKSPGLVILEHELTDETVQIFMDHYHLMVANDWKLVSVAELDGSDRHIKMHKGQVDLRLIPFPGTTGSGNAVVSNSSIISSSTTNHWTSSLASSTAGPNGSIRKNGASSTPSSARSDAMTLLAGFTALHL